MALSDSQWLFLQDVAKLINTAEELGFKVTGGELFRTEEQQKIHFDAGRSKTMNSKHRKRLAIDLNFFIEVDGKWKITWKKEDIQPLGEYWEGLSKGKNSWGGFWKFKDVPHFQRDS